MNSYDYYEKIENEAKQMTRHWDARSALEILKKHCNKQKLILFFEMEFEHCIKENILCERAKNEFISLTWTSYIWNIAKDHSQYAIQYATNYSVLKTLLQFELDLNQTKLDILENQAIVDCNHIFNALSTLQEIFLTPYNKKEINDVCYYWWVYWGIYENYIL